MMLEEKKMTEEGKEVQGDPSSSNENEKLFQEIADKLSLIKMVQVSDIPAIPLYMDQVTTFFDMYLEETKRNDNDKILTKTMINNYAKNSLLPSPDRKKYTRDHMILLLFIYFFKNTLSITDIETLMHPVTEKYFGKESEDGENTTLSDIYEIVTNLEKKYTASFQDSCTQAWNMVSDVFDQEGVLKSGDDREMLEDFAYLCLLNYDIYLKKCLVEGMIDHMMEKNPNPKKRR